MDAALDLEILPQPDDTTCGPTCLHAIYRYYGDMIPLAQVIDEVKSLAEGGTLAVFLASHALSRGYRATIYTYNLQVFDPTWFPADDAVLRERLARQAALKQDKKLSLATEGYLTFLERGGKVRFEELTSSLIRHYARQNVPVLTGLSATYLYRTAREVDRNGRIEYNDVEGVPSGHFVVLCGYNREQRWVSVADPLHTNPISNDHYYDVNIDRLKAAILLGILTYDANLLIIEPVKKQRSS